MRVIVKEILAVSALLSQENIRCGPEERGHHASPRLGCGAGLRTHIYCYRVYSKPTHFNIQGPGAGLGWAGSGRARLGNIHYAGYPPAGAWADNLIYSGGKVNIQAAVSAASL